MYTYLFIYPRGLKASGRGQDKRGRRRSAAIRPDEILWEHVGQMQQHIADCGEI